MMHLPFFFCKPLSECEYIFGITITVLKISQNNDNRGRHLEFYLVLPSLPRSQFKFRFRFQFRIPDSGFRILHTPLFKMAGKVVVDEGDKIIEFLTLILFHFLRFGDIKIPIEIENQYIVLILDETFRGVMIF